MLAQYSAIKRKFEDAILFYRMGDFYEMFYEDAKAASEILGLRLTSRAHGKGANVPLAGFPYHQLDNYLTRMVEAGRRVVIVEQVEDPKKAKGLVKRDVVRVVTAGTNPALVEDEEKASANIAAIVRHDDRFGYAWTDIISGVVSAGNFSGDEVRIIAGNVAPIELVVPAATADVGPTSVGNFKPQVVSKLEDWIWEYEFARRTLTDHFATVGLKGFGIEGNVPAVSAAGALIYYIKQNLRCEPAHITQLTKAELVGRLFIEPSARRNLELTESLAGNSKATLLAVIDRTVTTAGRRLLTARLVEPLAEAELINERLDAVEEFYRNSLLRDNIRALLKMTGDVQRYLARLATARSSARDLVALRETLALLPDLIDLLARVESPLAQACVGRMNPLPDLRALLQGAIVDEPPLATNEGGLIRDGFDAKVDELRRLQTGGQTWLEDLEKRERAATSISNLRVAYNRVFGYYIEITKSHLEKVPPHYIRRQTLTNAERYTLPELKEYEEKLISAADLVNQRENEIFQSLVARVIERASVLQENAQALAEFDFLTALAELAGQEQYHRPVIAGDDRLELFESRHPVVEKMLPPGEKFVPNDLAMGGDEARIYIVTGPNMAGKSTYLRQAALCVILAQMGSFVPAKCAHIGVADKLFTRIGALDNLAGGESTFLVEMQETAAILNNATPRSLVLFDEIGRGTSTFDGLSLAWSIVEYIHENLHLKPRTLFATHFHEMTDLEKYLKSVRNLNVAVREYGDKVLFLRKIIPGGSDRSFGIYVAQMAGIPSAVIRRAKEVLANLEANDLSPGEANTAEDASKHHRSDGKRILRTPQKHFAQLTFFDPVEHKLREQIEKADVDTMTPLEALRFLNELRRLAKNEV